ncbi:MAG: ECF-type sigma factor [Planctomycetota bacterium]
MSKKPTDGVTRLLQQVDEGQDDAFADLIELVYEDLRGVARRRLRNRFGERLDQLTLRPTMLADDALMELKRQHVTFQNSEHFFAIATRMILRMITDYQRSRMAQKRGGGNRGVSIDENRDGLEAEGSLEGTASLGPEVRDALAELHELDPRKAEVCVLHTVAGMSLPRVAELVGVSLPTVERDWRFAKAWLASKVSAGQG